MDRVTLFADVIIPVPIPNLYTYRVPEELNDEVLPGKRVVVPFGRSKHYTGLIRRVHEEPPRKYTAKYLDAVLDDMPIVDETQFEFWEWLVGYYVCTPGEVMNAALPSGLKLDSEHNLVFHPDFEKDFTILNDREYLVAEAIELQERVRMKDVADIVGIKTIQPIIKGLIEKRVVVVEEDMKERYRPKTVMHVQINPEHDGEEKLHALLDTLQASKSKRGQLEIMMAYLHLSNAADEKLIPKKELLDFTKVSVSPLNTLIKKGILMQEEIIVNRLSVGDEGSQMIKALSKEQDRALNEIKEGFAKDKVTLLHGVTSSGKTEVYVKLIQECLDRGEQVLYLLPEIALTTQLIARLKQYFGDKIGVYHSRYSVNERVEVWNRVLSDGEERFSILMGARSCLFLPFKNLGLIIVDEEHENTFKQFDPAPRYHARDAAIVLGKLHQAPVLLGSATPGIETYWHAQEGRYHLVELMKRFGDVKLPEILCADIKKESREKTMKSHFSSFLLEHMEAALENKEQIILFQNRRGYTPMWQCEDCGWVPQCVRCDVSLTYHKKAHLLTCHYCGYAVHPPRRCDACGSSRLQMKGFGTEKIEDELSVLYPDLKLGRMDLDTTRSKYGYQKLIESFDEGEIDVLIGTQMVSKGLDFDNVGLVGILNADQMLNWPDFRSFERSYQLMSQVAGRAGRAQKRGKVIIQSYNPDHWIIRQVIDSNYRAMYDQELFERKSYSYPPFFRLIRFTVRHKDKDVVRLCADQFANRLRDTFKNRVLGPEDPMVGRVNNFYLKHVLLKLERELSPAKVRQVLLDAIEEIKAQKDFKSARIIVDVDPV